MKTLLLCLTLIPTIVFAQKIDLKDVDADSDSTTIEISKGRKNSNGNNENCKAIWEVTEGNADISGDGATMMAEAKKNHKKACEDWKKEFRQDNKDNKVISVNCGVPSCASEAMEKVCVSKASYKVKTRID